MKILLIGAKRFPNSREGGIDIVVSHLAEELTKQGHDVTILVRRKRGYKPPKTYNGIRIKSIFTINIKSTDAIIYSFFATIFAKFHRFDVLHFHALGNTLFLNLLRHTKKKIVATIHGLDWKRDKFSKIGKKILKKSEKRVAKYAHDIITLCPSDSSFFEETYSRHTTIIPNGVVVPKIVGADLIKEKFGLYKDSYILFLARIVPEKGLEYLIKAYNQIVNPTKKLIIAGGSSHSESYYNEMVLLAKNNKNIIFTGFVQGTILEELFSNAFFYVLPSTIEGMPISLIEALSYKNICLCSDIDELKSIGSKNCRYFKNSDVEDLSHILRKMMNDDKEAFIEENIFYSWKTVAELTADVYQRKK